MTRLLCIIAVIVAGTSSGVSAAPQRHDRPKVRTVSIDGNSLFTDDRLLKLMATRPPGFLSSTRYHEALFNDDLDNVLAFYRGHGHLDAFISDTSVTLDSATNTVDIRFALDEGPQTTVEALAVFGNTVFDDSTVLDRIPLKPGDPCSPVALQNGTLAVLRMYADTGYLDARVEPAMKVNEPTHRAVIDLVVSENRQVTIDSVLIAGLDMTNEHVVLRELEFGAGDILSYGKLLQAQRRLYLTGLFESVFVRPDGAASGAADRRNVVVEVTESMYGEFNVAAGYGSVEKPRVRIEISHRNLAGTARQLGGRIDASFIKQGITASFTEPRTVGSRWRTDINALFELQQEPSYDLTRYGWRAAIGRSVLQNGTLTFTYRFENTSLTKVEALDYPDDIDPRIRSLSVSFANDTRDDPFDPRRGSLVDIHAELAGGFLRGTNSFARTEMNAKRYWPAGRYTTFASAARVGWQDAFGSSGDIPISERFFAGGPTALRGLEYQRAGPVDNLGNPLGGKFIFVWNVIEVRRIIYKVLGAALFLDVGNVFPAITDFSIGDLRASAGPGLRAGTPIGILRLDWGINLDRKPGEPAGQVYFSMGHAF